MLVTPGGQPSADSRFYVIGGTLEPDAPSYIERQADTDLYAGLTRGEFCYVLTSRQMGKSSLMGRTAARLRESGAAVASIDLTGIGQHLTVEQWYDGLLRQVAQELDLEAELEVFWRQHPRLGPVQRWMAALQEVVLRGRGQGPGARGQTDGNAAALPDPSPLSPDPSRLVIFIDEIDAVRSLPFSTDEFFAAIRACYNRRSSHPEFHRLTFCLLGVAAPTDLVQDTRTTPFNIGTRIELTDFTETEAAPLAVGLLAGTPPPAPPLEGAGCLTLTTLPEERKGSIAPPSLAGKPGTREAGGGGLGPAGATLRRILYWTGGHPSLTQRLCQAVAAANADNPKSKRPISETSTALRAPARNPKSVVDRICTTLFLCPQARERDDNLLFVRDQVLRSEADPAGVLELYARVRRGQRVRDDETHRLVSVLRLSGIVRAEFGRLRVRNRIYERAFDRAWVAEHMPDAELRRQRAAYRRGLLRAAAVSAAVLTVMAGLALTALHQAHRADLNAHRATVRAREARAALMGMAQARDRADREAARARAAQHGERAQFLRADAARRQAETAGTEADRERKTAVQQRQIAVAKQTEAESERRRATQSLLESYLAQARALRFSGRAGRRFDALAVLAKAAAVRPSLALRNEAIACMALSDIRIANRAIKLPTAPWIIMPDRDYRYLACGDRQGCVSVRRLADDRELVRLPGSGGPVAEIGFFSHDARFLPVYCGDDRILYSLSVWDLRHRKVVLRSPRGTVPVGRVAFSADGRRVAVVYGDRSIHLFDLPSGKEFRRLTSATPIYTIALRPDGRQLAVSGLAGHTVEIWDLETGRVDRLLTHPDVVYGIDWSPDGRLLATGCHDRAVRVWDVASGRQIQAMQGHQESPVRIAFNRDGSLLASTSWDASVRLWDPHGGTELVRADVPIACLQFSPDDRQVGLFQRSLSEEIHSLELAPGRECRTLHAPPGADHALWNVDFDPRARLLAVAGRDGLRLWDLTRFKETCFLPVGFTQSAVFDRTGRHLITSGDAGLYRRPIEIDPGTGEKRIGTGEPIGEKTPAGRSAWSADGRVLALVDSGRVRVFDSRNPSRGVRLDGLPGVLTVAVSPDGRWVAAGAWGADDIKIQAWDLQRKTRLNLPITGTAHLAFSPDGQWLVTGRIQDYRFWRVGTWEPGPRIPRDPAAPRVGGTLAFSRDGKLLAIERTPQLVELIDPASGRELATLEPPNPQRVAWLSFSPDGGRLAVAGLYGLIHIWDLRLIRQELAAMGLDWRPPQVR